MKKEINRVLFLGSKNIGYKIFKEIYNLSNKKLIGAITIDDSNDLRSTLEKFTSFSNKKNISLYIAKNNKQASNYIKKLKPDLCIVVCWYWIIKKEILNIAPFGFIGIHNSLLPKYRGGSPLVWSIINNEKRIGFSIFSLTPGMDDGPIWEQTIVKVDNEDNISDIIDKFEKKTVKVFQKTYNLIISGKIKPTAQNHNNASFCAQRLPKDGNIDWHRSAKYVYDFIRAQSFPYPGAYTYLNENKIKVLKAKLFDKIYYGTPGQVAMINNEGVFVICGDNRAIILEELEISGNRRKSNEFIKSIKTRLKNFTSQKIQ